MLNQSIKVIILKWQMTMGSEFHRPRSTIIKKRMQPIESRDGYQKLNAEEQEDEKRTDTTLCFICLIPCIFPPPARRGGGHYGRFL